MTPLPANLAVVAEDLARATERDARRAAKRRRAVTLAVVLALLALTASAAIATGWVTDSTPATRAVASLAGDPGDTSPHVVLTDLGKQARVLTTVRTSAGSVCLSITGFETQCVSDFRANQQLTWFVQSLPDGTTGVFGIARDDVRGIDAVGRHGRTVAAQLASGAFYLELIGVVPTEVTVHLSDGSSNVVPIAPCPAASPDCVS
jgi:hypothetical protein